MPEPYSSAVARPPFAHKLDPAVGKAYDDLWRIREMLADPVILVGRYKPVRTVLAHGDYL